MFWKSFNSVIAPLCILIPIIAGLIKFRSLPFNLKLIWYYLLVTALINTIATIIRRVYHINNLPLVHLFNLAQGLMLISFYNNTHLIQITKTDCTFFCRLHFLLFVFSMLYFSKAFIYIAVTPVTPKVSFAYYLP